MRRASRSSRGETDELIFELIDERRAEQAGERGGDDVLAMLLEARHEDGSPMCRRRSCATS